MIYLYTKDRDTSVEAVIDWLTLEFKEEVFRFDVSSDLFVKSIELNNLEVSCRIMNGYGAEFELNKVTAAWFHGGGIHNQLLGSNDPEAMTIGLILAHDSKSIIHFINEYIISKGVRSIGAFKNYKYIKLNFLRIAQSLGIDIPKTVLTSEKLRVIEFKKECYTGIITKNLDTAINLETDEWVTLGHRTQIVTNDELGLLGERFYPTLFQEKLDKLFELRIYFLKDKLYPMAIFSQTSADTEIDYRVFNPDKANRCVPYTLPQQIEEHLRQFISLVDLDTGSIDMVVTKDKRYVFLELNPFGQMAFLSRVCNYNIEKDIARFLIKNNQCKSPQ